MLEKHVWRDFAAVTFSVAVLGLGLGSTLPLTALVRGDAAGRRLGCGRGAVADRGRSIRRISTVGRAPHVMR